MLPAYRMYHLDGNGRFSRGEWIDATDDESALAAARERSRRAEVWAGDRLVGRVDSDRA